MKFKIVLSRLYLRHCIAPLSKIQRSRSFSKRYVPINQMPSHETFPATASPINMPPLILSHMALQRTTLSLNWFRLTREGIAAIFLNIALPEILLNLLFLTPGADDLRIKLPRYTTNPPPPRFMIFTVGVLLTTLHIFQ